MNFLDPNDKEFFYGSTVGPIDKKRKAMAHSLKLKQKRIWVDNYNNEPTSLELVVLWIGEQIVVVREMDGEESSHSIEGLMENTIEAKKLRKK